MEYNKKYKFKFNSTQDVEVLSQVEQWISFHENEFIHHGEYVGMWKMDEKGPTERQHFFHEVLDRKDICGLEYYYSNDENLWTLKVFHAAENLILTFFSKENCEKMFNLFCEYKGYAILK